MVEEQTTSTRAPREVSSVSTRKSYAFAHVRSMAVLLKFPKLINFIHFSAQVDDAGSYSCLVKNRAGETVVNFQLIVLGKTVIITSRELR